MDRETLNILANLEYRNGLVKELMKADPTISEEQAKELVAKDFQRYAHNEGQVKSAVEVIAPVVLGSYVKPVR